MHSKKNSFLHIVRIIIDVLNVIFGITVVAVAVYTFVDIDNRMYMFQYIFYLGAFINLITGLKHFISERVIYGIVVWVFAAVLVSAGLFSRTIIGGM